MAGKLLVFCAATLILANAIPILAAPSAEPCPNDSVLGPNGCECHPDSCTSPPCPTKLVPISNGTNEPGNCCPIYSCTECPESNLLNGKCPCAPGAVLNGNKCECIDKEKDLINGECVCDPSLCPLEQVCDAASVRVHSEPSECCQKTECLQCPKDSFATNKNNPELDEMCVCYPCGYDCPINSVVNVIKHGKNIPGHCCDLYQCRPNSTKNDSCKSNNKLYENGAQWVMDEKICTCNQGMALCNNQLPAEKNCIVEGKIFKDNESWTMEDGCTLCKCKKGEQSCIAFYCDVKKSEKRVNMCPSMVSCNKSCSTGYKMKKGCPICKCNPSKYNEVLEPYNMTPYEISTILDDYLKKKQEENNGTEKMVQNSSNTLVPITNAIPLDPTVVKTDKCDAEKPIGIIFLILGAILIIIISGAIYCCFCRKLKQQYKTVNNNNNNLLDQSIEHEKYKKVPTKL